MFKSPGQALGESARVMEPDDRDIMPGRHLPVMRSWPAGMAGAILLSERIVGNRPRSAWPG